MRHVRFKFLCKHNRLLRLASRFSGKKINFAHQNLDKLISDLLPSPGFYVELGANDGISQSNTKYLEVYEGWKGVLIEPSPVLFSALMKNRSKSNSFHNCACVSFGYSGSSMKLLYSNLRTIALDGINDIQDRVGHAQLGQRKLKVSEKMEIFNAPAKTLDRVLSEANAPNLIDFLSLDVEGAEIEVLRGLNFEIYNFKLILIETRSFESINVFLTSHGYQLIRQLNPLDYLYKLQHCEISKIEITLDNHQNSYSN